MADRRLDTVRVRVADLRELGHVRAELYRWCSRHPRLSGEDKRKVFSALVRVERTLEPYLQLSLFPVSLRSDEG